MLTVVIVDDSRLARVELVNLLGQIADIDILGEAENVDNAKALIDQTRPDLVLLDINMPEKDGFDLLTELTSVPEVIFTTAYDQYAIKSFEYNALDYVLKPVTAPRLEQALEKVRDKLKVRNAQDDSDPLLTPDSQFFVKDGDNCWLVKLGEVSLIESVGNYSRLYFANNKPMIYKALSKIQARLAPGIFFRANRQQLVNMRDVVNVEPLLNESLELSLKNGTKVNVSRRQSVEFKTLFKL
ncbi:response regulator [Aliiglaciecola sp. LCG003]|uniref:LytR/AlgR family response regulator transcription factor n=1 Tax=Aliiglaciecola sp. LCG003 TaxID=3053655 RepID=UPI00257338BB|nr:response regulator [Aliiglaciecola sp. LCG003]WJG08692.1 response regulator [Aliiglaciecola sp. LCG003]